MMRGSHKLVLSLVILLAAGIGFGAAYQRMEEDDRLTAKRLALVCGAPLSFAALLTWTILKLSKKR